MSNWLILSQNSGTGDTTITVTAKTLSDALSRTAMLRISGQTTTGLTTFLQSRKHSEVPDNEVWYVSTNSQKITPANYSWLATHTTGQTFDGTKGCWIYHCDEPVKEIGGFVGTSNLLSINYPTCVTAITNSAFNNCTNLVSIGGFSNNIHTIGTSAFENCGKFGDYIYLNGDVVIEFSPYTATFGYSSGITDVYIHSGVTWNPESGTTITDNTYVGAGMFSGCKNLTSITVCEGVRALPAGFAMGCTGLTSIVLPNSLQIIPSYAFKGCTSLSSVTIGTGTTQLGHQVFSGCTSLTQITCEAHTAPTISSTTFQGIASNGTLIHPHATFTEWLSTEAYCLGYYGWT